MKPSAPVLPGFLVAGAPKAGTTTIHATLAGHPEVFLPHGKELHFFDDDAAYARGPGWYARHFEAGRGRAAVGEITPAYMSYEDAPARIRQTLGPDVRLVFVLREPVSRAYSEYLHNERRGFVTGPFEEACRLEFRRPGLSRWERRKYSFLSRGFYATQLERFLALFPRESLLVLLFEADLVAAPVSTMERIQAFIGVTPITLETQRHNVAFTPRSAAVQRLLHGRNRLREAMRTAVPSPRLRSWVRRRIERLNDAGREPEALDPSLGRALFDEYFREETQALEKLLGRSLEAWRSRWDGGDAKG